MTDVAAHTHYLHAAYKAGNGRRMTKDFPLTTEQATDPHARQKAISNASAYGFGRDWNIVNWTVKEGAIPAPKAKAKR